MPPNQDRSRKTCPVLLAYLAANSRGLRPEEQPCIQSRCRWWIGDDCAVSWAGRLARAVVMGQRKTTE